MNHLEVYQIERCVPVSEQHWVLWAQQVERLLCHSLDGDQAKDGYSLDYAYDAFKAGAMPDQFVDSIRN